jgi:hypothetical protein
LCCCVCSKLQQSRYPFFIATIARVSTRTSKINKIIFSSEIEHQSAYQYHYGPQQYQAEDSGNYLEQHYENAATDHFPHAYHNLTGYPQPGRTAQSRGEFDYLYDYDYQYETPEPQPAKKSVIFSPHPMVTAAKKIYNGIQSRTLDLGFLSGNTVVS